MAEITIQRTPDAPFEQVDEAALVKSTGTDASGCAWVEYRFPGDQRVVHRSVTAAVTGCEATSAVGGVG